MNQSVNRTPFEILARYERLALAHASDTQEKLEAPGLWRGNYLGRVGYAEGRPICAAATCTGPEGIGLYSVATSFAYRGRGYGEAITRAAIDRASLQFGTTRAILQSTTSGLALYQRLGFRPTTSILVYTVV